MHQDGVQKTAGTAV